MAKRKATTEETAVQPAPVQTEAVQAAAEPQATTAGQKTSAAPEAQSHAPIAAPPKGEGRSWTIDNRLGYRKEESADGKKRQIRFADREGGRPDDETLTPVREKKPAVSWSAKEKAWQARKDQDGLEALDLADQQLAELGRKKTRGPEC